MNLRRTALLLLLIGHSSSQASASNALEVMGHSAPGAAPLLDTPLRDPAITRAPDGAYYLTGTSASAAPRPDGTLDFANNDGIHLWSSPDLATWKPLGKVFALDGAHDRGNPLRWTQYHRLNPADPDGPWVRGIQSPELHYIRGGYYLAFAMSGGGTGLLKSSSDKPDGPYAMHARLTTRGDTPSLFQDGEARYWLWDGGWIARLNDDLTALAEPPRLLQPAPESQLNDYPLQVGSRGAFLFKHAGKYHLVATEVTSRLGGACHDTFVARADSIYGPYEPRRFMIAHGGQTTLFLGPDGEPWSTFGGDAFATFKDRPGVVPLVDDGFLKHLHLKRPTVTAGHPVMNVRPITLPGSGIRDPQILLAPDGHYYLTGTSSKAGLRVPGCRVWRSRDLLNWTPLGDEHGVVWYVDQTEWTRRPFQTDAVPYPVHDFWAPEIHHIKGDYFIPFCMFGGGTGLLKSTSGKPDGPYVDWSGRLHTWAGDPSLFVDDDGTVYMHLGFGPTRLVKMSDDLKRFDGDPFDIGPADGSVFGHEGGTFVKMAGKYVLFYTTLNGEEESERKAKPGIHQFSTYDLVYCWSDHLRGPYTTARIAVPHGGHGSVFQDKTGRWLATMFGTDRTAHFRGKLGILPLDVKVVDGDLRITVSPDPLPPFTAP